MVARAGIQCGSTVDCGWAIIGWLALAAVVLAIPVDFVCLAITVTVFGGMVRSGEWDLLTLTEQPEAAIVDSRYTIALARVWRPLALATNFRLAAVLCFALWLAVLRFDATLLIVIPIVVGLSSAFVLEPRWRIRALAAIGLAVSTWTRQSASAVLAGMLIVFLIWATQAAIVLLLYWTLRQSWVSVIYCCPLTYAGIALMLFFGYRQIGKWALAFAIRRMVCCADDLR